MVKGKRNKSQKIIKKRTADNVNRRKKINLHLKFIILLILRVKSFQKKGINSIEKA